MMPGSAMAMTLNPCAARVCIMPAGSAKVWGSHVNVRNPSMCWMSSHNPSAGIDRVRNSCPICSKLLAGE